MSLIKKKLQNNELVIGTFMKSSDPSMAEVLGCTGLDFLVLDNEHVSMNTETLTNIIRAAQLYGIEPVVRVTCNEQSNILQVLDAGAAGVQVPNIDTLEQAHALQKYAKYMPLGCRGFSPSVRAARYGSLPIKEYIAKANQETLVVAHCETVTSWENLDDILKVPGIDVIFIGPMDLSQSLNIVGEMDNPILKDCIADITKRALAAGKIVGILASPNAVADYAAMGIRYILIGTDQSAVVSFYKGALNTINNSTVNAGV